MPGTSPVGTTLVDRAADDGVQHRSAADAPPAPGDLVEDRVLVHGASLRAHLESKAS